MARLSRIQEQVRAQVGQMAGSNLLPEPLGRRLLDVLRQAFPADIQALFGVDPASLLFNRLLAAGAGESVMGTVNWLEHVYLTGEPSPDGTFPAFMRDSLAVVAVHPSFDRSWGLPRTSISGLSDREYAKVVHEIGTPAGGILRGCFAVAGRWVAALEFGRFEPGEGFRPTDVAFLRLLAPAIGRALDAAFTREQAAATTGTVQPDAAGVVVLAPDGKVRFCTPAAAAWFGVLRDTLEPAAPGVVRLPTSVLAAVAGLRAGRDNGASGRILAPTPSGFVRIEASRGGDDGSVAIVLSAEPQPALPVAPAWWPLTTQERATVNLAVQGRRNREIAARLAVTENTVQTHLAHAYDKLGVRGRGQLLARLFRDAYLPNFPLPAPAGDEHPFWINIAD